MLQPTEDEVSSSDSWWWWWGGGGGLQEEIQGVGRLTCRRAAGFHGDGMFRQRDRSLSVLTR